MITEILIRPKTERTRNTHLKHYVKLNWEKNDLSWLKRQIKKKNESKESDRRLGSAENAYLSIELSEVSAGWWLLSIESGRFENSYVNQL